MAKNSIKFKLPVAKRKRGRPSGTKIKIDYQRLENLAARGLNKEQIALCLDISARTLAYRQIEDEKFKEALERGTATGIAAVAGELLKAIKQGDVRAMIFYLKCKAGWKETAVMEYRNPIEIPDEECTIEEAEAAYRAAMQMIQEQ